MTGPTLANLEQKLKNTEARARRLLINTWVMPMSRKHHRTPHLTGEYASHTNLVTRVIPNLKRQIAQRRVANAERAAAANAKRRRLGRAVVSHWRARTMRPSMGPGNSGGVTYRRIAGHTNVGDAVMRRLKNNLAKLKELKNIVHNTFKQELENILKSKTDQFKVKYKNVELNYSGFFFKMRGHDLTQLFHKIFLNEGTTNLFDMNSKVNINDKTIDNHEIVIGDFENIGLFLPNEIREIFSKLTNASPKLVNEEETTRPAISLTVRSCFFFLIFSFIFSMFLGFLF
jgi:hypothetical protein